MKRTKTAGNRKAAGAAQTLLTGIGVAAAVLAALVMICAKLILSGTIAESLANIVSFAAVGVSALCGSVVCAKMARQRKLPMGMACAGIEVLLLGILHAMFIQQPYVHILEIVGCCLAGGLLGSLLGAKEKNKRRFA